jgi:hypothetical protein
MQRAWVEYTKSLFREVVQKKKKMLLTFFSLSLFCC